MQKSKLNGSKSMPYKNITVNSPSVKYTKDHIFSLYSYQHNIVEHLPNKTQVTPISKQFLFKTAIAPRKTGIMLVGLGGNNGSTLAAGIIANKLDLSWRTKDGLQKANYLGSITQCATMYMGQSSKNLPIHSPLSSLIPLLDPNQIAISGWDINSNNLKTAMERSKVLPSPLQALLAPEMENIKPLPSVYYPSFIAANQKSRADHCLTGTNCSTMHLQELRKNIRDFKEKNCLEKVIVVWTANTERFCVESNSVHGTEDSLLAAIAAGHPEVSPSQVFAMAAIMENCTYINGSPQNTFVPGIIKAAAKRNVFLAGDDFKTGQTKLKSVLVDFLVSSGIKPESIVSYNHLGNNDGQNLSSQAQFESKRVSKSNVIDDMVHSNQILFSDGKAPDHTVVIKYVPFVGDSKRAMDEYVSRIFLNGLNTIVIHNTCEDSLLAVPVIIDLIVLAELMERIQVMEMEPEVSSRADEKEMIGVKRKSSPNGKAECIDKILENNNSNQSFSKMKPMLSVLSFLMKAPRVLEEEPCVNSLFRQLRCIKNVMRACVGLAPESDMFLQYKV